MSHSEVVGNILLTNRSWLLDLEDLYSSIIIISFLLRIIKEQDSSLSFPLNAFSPSSMDCNDGRSRNHLANSFNTFDYC